MQQGVFNVADVQQRVKKVQQGVWALRAAGARTTEKLEKINKKSSERKKERQRNR